jgi:anti-sigma B factor antagonist
MTEHGKLPPPLEHDFEVDVEGEARGTVVTVSGELDVATSQTLEHELGKLQGTATVVVDLRGLTFIDSTGLGVLVRAHQLAKEQSRRFGLVRGNGQVDRLLNLTGLDTELLMGDSAEQLLAGE